MMFLRQLPRVFSNVVPIVFPAALTAFLLVGCGKSEITELRERFVLADEPSGAKVVSKIRATLQKDHALSNTESRFAAGAAGRSRPAGLSTDFDSRSGPYPRPAIQHRRYA